MTAASALREVARARALDTMSVAWRMSGCEARAVSLPRIHFPYLHAVAPAEEERFRKFLRWLARSHSFVSYSEAVRRVQSGEVDEPCVAISFDDGFASNVRAAKILEEFGAVGCFFVVTDFIGTRTRAEARKLFGYTNGVDEGAMTWAELETLKVRGHEVGNHTRSHRVMSSLTQDQLRDEVWTGAETLRSRMGECRHFAWPYGRLEHFTAGAAQMVFDAGHESCASAVRGAHPPSRPVAPHEVCLSRDHIMMEWPLRHSRFWIAASATGRGRADSSWPAGWKVPHV